MTFEEINKEWAQDSILNQLALDSESLKIPSLHAKWWRIMNEERKALRELSETANAMERVLDDYYSRTISVEEMQKYGFKELPEKKVLKPDMPKVISSHPKMIAIKLRLGTQKDKVEYLMDIIKSIHNRSFAIRDAIEFRKFQNGQ
jgi:hypothetical protein